MKIQQVGHAELKAILPLIADYQRFYKQEPSDERNLAHFGRLIDEPGRGIQFMACDEAGVPLGFTTLYVIPSSLTAHDGLTLNDLFVSSRARRGGVGAKLIAHARRWAAYHGYAEIEWMTADTNTTAQALYDALPDTTRSSWFVYTATTRGDFDADAPN
jgi:GNAT superfamily N-acetyltransferase